MMNKKKSVNMIHNECSQKISANWKREGGIERKRETSVHTAHDGL